MKDENMNNPAEDGENKNRDEERTGTDSAGHKENNAGRTERDYEKLEFKGIRMRPDGGDDEGSFRNSKIYKWLDNFWYHHKWKVVVISFFAVIIGICVYQYASREVPDVYVMYAGPEYLSSGATSRLKESLRTVMEDYNGDGETGITMVTLVCVSDDEIEEMKAEAVANSEEFYLDASANSQNIKQFSMEIFAGESVICMLDPWLYEDVRDAGGFMEMSELFTEEELEGVELYDECGIYLSSTKFYKYYSSVSVLPEDTVLCIRKISTMSVFKGKAKYEKLHEYHESMFRSMVLFDYPEGYELPESSMTEAEDTLFLKRKLFTS